MLLKKVTPFRIEKADFTNLPERLSTMQFVPTLPTQLQSRGFAAVLDGLTDDLVLTIGTFEMARFVVETRNVPASALREETEKLVKKRETLLGRELSRDEKASIKDAIHLDMIKGVPPTRTSFFVAISAEYLLPFTTNAKHIESLIGDLRDKMESGLRVVPCFSGVESFLTPWLSLDGEGLPEGFNLGDSAKFKGENGDSASLTNVILPCPESTSLLNMPSVVVRLGLLTEHLSFVLTDKGSVLSLKPTDLLAREMLDDVKDIGEKALQIIATMTIELDAIEQAIFKIWTLISSAKNGQHSLAQKVA